MRKQSPRDVCENPSAYEFKSVNFDLLNAVFDQLHENQRGEFIEGLLVRVESGGGTAAYPEYFFPKFAGAISELPLVAEFSVRNGYVEEFFAVIGCVEQPSIGLVLMLLQLEEMVALNFNIFSEKHYCMFPSWLTSIREAANRQVNKAVNGFPDPERTHIGKQIVRSVNNLLMQARQAEYYYLKGALRQTPNIEIDNDKTKVYSFIDLLGFDPLLAATLKRGDDIYYGNPDAFDLKSCIGHFRSFLEHLHIDAGLAIARSVNKTVKDEWDPVMTFLRNDGFFTAQQDKFARGLYALLSDEGVHPLIAEREFARLLRNMSIEYGLMFLTMFEKKSIRAAW